MKTKTPSKTTRTRAVRKHKAAPRVSKRQVAQQRNKRLAFFVAILVAICGIAGAAVLWAAGDSSGQFYSGVNNQRCLDNSRGALEPGNTIMLYTCNTSRAQKWEVVGATIRQTGTAYCLDTDTKSITVPIANGRTQTQTGLVAVLDRCNRQTSQQWKFDDAKKQIVNTSTKMCLEVVNGSANDRTPLWLRACSTSVAQKWYLRKASNVVEAATVKVSGTPVRKVDFQVGFDYTHHSALFGGGNAAAVSSAKAVAKSLNAPQSTHILGFGLGSPSPSAGKYTWKDLDARINMMRDTTSADQRTVILCCAPKWMKGTKTDADSTADLEKAPTKANYDKFATLSAEVAKHYPDVKNFVVWNELKGFNENATNYTEFYNKVYTAVKKVRPDAKVGGPYMGMHTDNPTGNETYGHLAPQSKKVVEYWMKNKTGADFIAVDSGPQLKNGQLGTDGYSAGKKFADDAAYLRSLPGAAGLPLWWMEFYPGTDKDARGVDPVREHAVSIGMSNIVTAGLAGVNRMFVWEPEGEANGAHPYTGYGIWTSTAKAGGGKATPFYTALKLLKDNFPQGTQIYQTSVTGAVTVMASGNKVLLISKSTQQMTVDVDGAKVVLPAHAVKVINR